MMMTTMTIMTVCPTQAGKLEGVSALSTALADSIAQPVRWHATCEAMIADGIGTFVSHLSKTPCLIRYSRRSQHARAKGRKTQKINEKRTNRCDVRSPLAAARPIDRPRDTQVEAGTSKQLKAFMRYIDATVAEAMP